MRIGNRDIGYPYSCYIVAEVGINHNGDVDTALKLIDAAKEAGADAVKFQKRTLDVCIPEHMRDRMKDTPWGYIPYMEYKGRLEFGYEEYDELFDHAKEIGIDMFASPWDEQSVGFLEAYDPPAYKVASAMITNLPLVKLIARAGKPVIVSKAGASMEQLEDALQVMRPLMDTGQLAIMHCVGLYPCPDKKLSLLDIPHIQSVYPNIPVGYSGHEIGIATSVAAVALGAHIVERHITLDRSMWGSDQSASLEPQGFERLVRDIRAIEDAMACSYGNPSREELEKMKTLRYFDDNS